MPYKTNSLYNTDTLNQGFVSNEIEDTYVTHLDLNRFCTVDNGLEGVAGDIRTINRYTGNGSAKDVAEGQGNGTGDIISVGLEQFQYQIKCAQAWYQYSDEAYQRDPVAVNVGISQLGVAMFNKVNSDIFDEFKKGTLYVKATTPDFDAFVDAVSQMTVKDAASEDAEGAQNRFINQTWAHVAWKDVAKLRKAMKDQLVYDPTLAWRQGYIGTVAGVNCFYRQDLEAGTLYVGTNRAVTVFNKTGVQTEIAARTGGVTGSANLRMNDLYARKYYLAALTDATQIVRIGLTGAILPMTETFIATSGQTAFDLAEDADAKPTVTINGTPVAAGDVTWSSSDKDAVTLAACTAGDVVVMSYTFTV